MDQTLHYCLDKAGELREISVNRVQEGMVHAAHQPALQCEETMKGHREHSSPRGLWAYHWVFTDLHNLHRPHPSRKERPLDGQVFSTSTGQLPNMEHLNLASRESLVFYGYLTYIY